MPYICTTPPGIALQAVVTNMTAYLATLLAAPVKNQGLISSTQAQLNLLQMELVDYTMIYEPAVMSAANILVVM